MNKIIGITYSYTKATLIAVLIFALLAGGAMALEPTVAHKTLGITTWCFAFALTAISAGEFTFSHYSSSYSEIREGEMGRMIRYIANISIFVLLLVMTTVSLAIH